MVAIPYPSPRRSAGSSGGGSGYVRERILQIDTVNNRDFVRYLASTSLSVADIVSLAQAVEPGVTAAAALKAEFMVCGSGGVGASGPGTGTGDDAVVWGGFPAHPVFHSVNVADLDATVPISIDVGAAVSGAMAGNYAPFGNSSTIFVTLANGQVYSIVSYGGDGGNTLTSDYRKSFFFMRSVGLNIDDPTIAAHIFGRINDSPCDPGIGAPFTNSTSLSHTFIELGGKANSASNDILTDNMFGFDGDFHFRAFGIGGRSSYPSWDPEYDSHDGGSPGGGGGAGDSAMGHAGGSGGAGEVRLQISILETV